VQSGDRLTTMFDGDDFTSRHSIEEPRGAGAGKGQRDPRVACVVSMVRGA
jgi:hypothetical protein